MSQDASFSPKEILILRNILISAVIGTLFGCALFPLFTTWLKVLDGRASFLDYKFSLKEILQSPLLIIFIIPLLVPLIVTACVTGVVFQESIRKHLALWCLIAPVTVWLVTIGILTCSAVNSFDEQFNWLQRFLINIPNPDHLLFLIAPAFSSLIFYVLSKRFKW